MFVYGWIKLYNGLMRWFSRCLTPRMMTRAPPLKPTWSIERIDSTSCSLISPHTLWPACIPHICAYANKCNKNYVYISTVLIYHIFFTCSSVDKHLGWFYDLVLKSNTVLSMDGHISQCSVVPKYLQHVSRSGMDGSYCSTTFSFVRRYTDFSTAFLLAVDKSSPSLHHYQQLLFFILIGLDFVFRERWILSVALVCISLVNRVVERF